MILALIIGGLCLIVGGAIYYSTLYKEEDLDNEEKKREVSKKYSTKMGWLAARKERKAAEARSGLLEALNTEQREIDANAEREEIAEVSQVTRQTQIARLKGEQLEQEMRNELMRLAMGQGMDITTYLKVTSHRELKQIDLEARAIEYRQDHENISRVQQEPLELIDRSTHRLFSMYEERKQLESSEDPAKEDKLTQLNHNISIAERLIRGEQDRYLQIALGQEGTRSLPAPDSTGRPEPPQGEGEEPERKRGRGRPRKNPLNEQGT